MRSSTSRTVLRATRAVSLLLLGACGRPPASGAPAPAMPATASSWRFALAPGEYIYHVANDAAILLATDTLAQRDSVTTSARVTYRLAPAGGGSLSLAGTVDSFTVVSGGRVQPANAPTAPVAFSGTIDPSRHHVELANALTGDCTSAATPLLAVARDLLVAPPPSFAVGTVWHDTVTTMGCRGTIPVSTRSVQRYEVQGADTFAGVSAVRIARASTVSLSGSASPRGQPVSIAGSGAAASALYFDPARGRFLGATGESTTKLTLSASGQSREFTQRVRQRVLLRGLVP